MGIRQWLLDYPWVYDTLRPLLMGGFDFAAPARWLQVEAGETVVDIGCGTGFALRFLEKGIEYHGFDTNERALEQLKRNRAEGQVNVYNRAFGNTDLIALQPHKVFMLGLLQQLSDAEVMSLLTLLRGGKRIKRIVTEDSISQDGRRFGNLLNSFTQAKFVRTEAEYVSLIEAAGWEVEKSFYSTEGNGIATQLCLGLVPLDPPNEMLSGS